MVWLSRDILLYTELMITGDVNAQSRLCKDTTEFKEPFYFRLGHMGQTKLYYNGNYLPWSKTMRHTRVTIRTLRAMLIVRSSFDQILL